MIDEKKNCLLTRLRSVMENMLSCGYNLEHEKSVKRLIQALGNNGMETQLSEVQIERAILILENEELERHREMLRPKPEQEPH